MLECPEAVTQTLRLEELDKVRVHTMLRRNSVVDDGNGKFPEGGLLHQINIKQPKVGHVRVHSRVTGAESEVAEGLVLGLRSHAIEELVVKQPATHPRGIPVAHNVLVLIPGVDLGKAQATPGCEVGVMIQGSDVENILISNEPSGEASVRLW